MLSILMNIDINIVQFGVEKLIDHSKGFDIRFEDFITFKKKIFFPLQMCTKMITTNIRSLVMINR